MISLTERLVGEGTKQDIEYDKELVNNSLAIARIAIISVAKKVENNVLHMMTAPVAMLQPAAM